MNPEASRARWSIIDQGVSSLGNLLLTVAVARVATVEEFGAFALALAFVRIAITANRSLSGEPMIVRFSASNRATLRQGSQAALGLSLLVGVVLGVVGAGTALIVGPTFQPHLVVASLGLPLVLVQDTWRYVMMAAGSPRRAAGGDLFWLIAQAGSFGVLAVSGLGTPAYFFIWWTITAGISALGFMARDRLAPDLGEGIAWFLAERMMMFNFAADYLSLQAAVQGAVVLVGVIGGLEAAGALRAAETFFGPATVIVLGLRTFGMHSGAVDVASGTFRLRSTMLAVTALGVAVAPVIALTGAFLPDAVGEALLGESWATASDVIPFFALAMCASASANGAYTGLRSLADGRTSFRVRAVEAPLLLLLSVIGTVVAGARGAAVGLAVAYMVGSVLAWRSFSAVARRSGALTGQRSYRPTSQ